VSNYIVNVSSDWTNWFMTYAILRELAVGLPCAYSSNVFFQFGSLLFMTVLCSARKQMHYVYHGKTCFYWRSLPQSGTNCHKRDALYPLQDHSARYVPVYADPGSFFFWNHRHPREHVTGYGFNIVFSRNWKKQIRRSVCVLTNKI
jgi:hypothetical protein